MCPLNIASIFCARAPTKRQEITCKGTYLSNRTHNDCHFLSRHHHCLNYYTFFLSKKILRIEEDNVFCIKKDFQMSSLNIYKGEEKGFLLLSCFGRADWRPRAQQQNCCTCSCATVMSSWWWLAQHNPSPQHLSLWKRKEQAAQNTQQTVTVCSLHFSRQTLGGASFWQRDLKSRNSVMYVCVCSPTLC